MKHTPGPYSVVAHSWAVTSIYAGGKRICVLDIEGEATEETQDSLEEQQAANASLLSSAPDLLEALKKANFRLQFADKHIDCSEEIALCAAAIAKVTGEV